MKAGILKIFFITFMVVFFITNLFSQEKVILEKLEPTFEEEIDNKLEEEQGQGISKIKSKNKKKNITNETIVNIKALDKITAKTSNIDIVVGAAIGAILISSGVAKELGVYPNVLEGVWNKNINVRPEEDWKELKGRAVVDE